MILFLLKKNLPFYIFKHFFPMDLKAHMLSGRNMKFKTWTTIKFIEFQADVIESDKNTEGKAIKARAINDSAVITELPTHLPLLFLSNLLLKVNPMWRWHCGSSLEAKER